MSSRNAYLSGEERMCALALPRTLKHVQELVANGETDAKTLEAAGRELLVQEVDAVDYLEVVDADSLERLETVSGAALVCGAVRVGRTRLIDNITVGANA